jgi:DMSO/TMAO reductase YedYZ molybdopterin-dependent catalytic subunit
VKLISVLLLILLVFSSGCIQPPIELEGVEVKEYEGKDLSSIQDFRENSIMGPQYINQLDYMLNVKGLVEEEKTFTYNQVVNGFQAYRKVVLLDCVEGWSVNILWEGILLRELLDQAKPTAQANTVILHAADGYSTSFPLEYFYQSDILLAYKMNGVPLPPERGFPFQLVAEDKWGYKWIKWITEIELSDDENYRGFWESRGYSNTGDLDEPYFE